MHSGSHSSLSSLCTLLVKLQELVLTASFLCGSLSPTGSNLCSWAQLPACLVDFTLVSKPTLLVLLPLAPGLQQQERKFSPFPNVYYCFTCWAFCTCFPLAWNDLSNYLPLENSFSPFMGKCRMILSNFVFCHCYLLPCFFFFSPKSLGTPRGQGPCLIHFYMPWAQEIADAQ